MKIGDYLFGLVVMVAIGWMSMSCKKNVEPQPLIPKTYDLPELDEEELDDLPEATEDSGQL